MLELPFRIERELPGNPRLSYAEVRPPVLRHHRTAEPLASGEGRRGLLTLPDKTTLFTLEPTPGTDYGHRLIPPGGPYRAIVSYRKKTTKAGNKIPCLWLYWGDPDGVEDHQIHVGNYLKDTLACILPGLVKIDTGVGQSEAAMDKLFESIGGGNYVEPTIGVLALLYITAD